jgi:hypothetical protein
MTRTSVFCGAIVVSFLISNASSFMIPHSSNSPRVPTTSLQAKQNKASKGGKGFGKDSAPTAPAKVNTAPADKGASPMEVSTFDGLSSVAGGSDAIPTSDESIPVDQRTSSILRDNYGLRTRAEQQEAAKREEAAKEQQKKLDEWKKLADEGKDFDIMEVLPAPVLIGLDIFLKAGLTISTVLFVLAGLGITVEAWSKTTGEPLPENIDHFIVNIIEPNFTPGLGVLLGFSVSLGAFAAAQLSSSSSTYRSDK